MEFPNWNIKSVYSWIGILLRMNVTKAGNADYDEEYDDDGDDDDVGAGGGGDDAADDD